MKNRKRLVKIVVLISLSVCNEQSSLLCRLLHEPLCSRF